MLSSRTSGARTVVIQCPPRTTKSIPPTNPRGSVCNLIMVVILLVKFWAHWIGSDICIVLNIYIYVLLSKQLDQITMDSEHYSEMKVSFVASYKLQLMLK